QLKALVQSKATQIRPDEDSVPIESSHFPVKSILLLALITGHVAAAPLVLHVAPDRPLATIEAALDKVRAARPAQGAVIVVHGGVYRLARPLVIPPEDSGPGASWPLSIEAFPGDNVVLSGGVPLTNWVKAKPSLWQADARAQLGTNGPIRS